jgi:hypothetical protein
MRSIVRLKPHVAANKEEKISFRVSFNFFNLDLEFWFWLGFSSRLEFVFWWNPWDFNEID